MLLKPENEELKQLVQAEHDAIKERNAADAAEQAAHEAVLDACGCQHERAGLRSCLSCHPANGGPEPARASRFGVHELPAANAMRPRAAPRPPLRALYANPRMRRCPAPLRPRTLALAPPTQCHPSVTPSHCLSASAPPPCVTEWGCGAEKGAQC